jgi:hypothetical protein
MCAICIATALVCTAFAGTHPDNAAPHNSFAPQRAVCNPVQRCQIGECQESVHANQSSCRRDLILRGSTMGC